MEVAFHADCVSAEDMDGFSLVGFADRKYGTCDYLMLQRSLDDDEQDIRLGMDALPYERNDQRWSYYGGIERFELYRDRIKVLLAPEGAARLGEVTAIDVAFSISDAEFEHLMTACEE